MRLRTARIGLLSGLIAGLTAGVGSRIAMRLVALDSGSEPAFSIGGTLFIILMGALLGVPLGLLFVAVRRWLPGPALVQGISFGVLSALLFLSLLVPLLLRETSELNSEIAGVNVLLAINVFVTPLIVYGLTVAMAVELLERPIARARRLRGATVVGDILLVAVGLVGTVGLVLQIANVVARSIQG